ncbi:ubiquitin-conjugating enzyme e2 2-like [Stylonychia lemnae]|uniref:Ubiquitin-conjugating enzyme e2 2-like n=1 Tax=Stylonychia lemnae TaxID=5949 RepID=A0A078BBR2_STYLE|nr:ubiquitin-conjugating enzyme e2 2-like [Stylonychia lemnae]|eukprot:CDW91824.1 ubiquitin-conjugating enzyme e2 2-like [Stylonychia lemnae]
MSTPARRRILADWKKYQNEGAGMGILLSINSDNMMRWEAVIFGPDDTEWEGGIFNLSMEFTEEYPTKPPKVVFLTKMYHPNIYVNGDICLDILQKKWTQFYDSMAIMQSLQQLLTDPNTESPANNEAAQRFDSNSSLLLITYCR